ncbi:MarR family transcriptional regulator [Streptomyces sp. NBC_01275]|uniref:MarR family winged helix-turn-helix transcriptional regulator n=1 Tax=Streptomyces sp. NBC_01275 TaxID=2903807 RepID=UPI00224D3A31|nr:MarR family transcriptional regulator [Streptomyces sp. NBC_01275]MCX4759602.1 MarR family transcriptional regulator [Streptomyces sp. NBC_01275]
MTARAAHEEPLTTVDALVQLSFLIQRVLAEVGGAHDLSIVQMRMLGALRGRRASMLALAERLGLDKSSMTGLVTRAEKRGLVRREPSPHDGRGVLVSLGPLGEELAARCTQEVSARIAVLTDRLTADERARLTGLAAALLEPAR